jgi:hypothetical protein
MRSCGAVEPRRRHMRMLDYESMYNSRKKYILVTIISTQMSQKHANDLVTINSHKFWLL